MTPKQERFVQEYLIDLNATQAAIRAGYSAKTAKQIGSRLLTYVDIQRAVSTKQVAVAEKADISVQWIVDRLRENLERALQAEAVLDHEGNPTGVYRYEGSVANKALELLGKHAGMWKETTAGGRRVMRFVFTDQSAVKGIEVIDD